MANKKPSSPGIYVEITGPLAEKFAALVARVERLEMRLDLLERKGAPGRVLKKKEAAALLSISVRSLERAIADGEIKVISHPFGDKGVEYAEIERYLARARG